MLEMGKNLCFVIFKSHENGKKLSNNTVEMLQKLHLRMIDRRFRVLNHHGTNFFFRRPKERPENFVKSRQQSA
jgi:hypothetical protein